MNKLAWTLPTDEMHLINNEVHIWHAKLTTNDEQLQRYLNILSSEEKKRHFRFHFEKHRRRFAIAHGMLRHVLSRYLDIAPNMIAYCKNEYGKPSLVKELNPQNICFNLSHSSDKALIAVTRTIPIGVDIETIKECSELQLSKRFFSEQEHQALAALSVSEQQQAFFHIWTQKEAFIKALGQGLHFSLQRFCVSTQPPARLISIDQHVDSAWTLESIPIDEHHCAAYATRQTVVQRKLWQFTASPHQ